MTQDVFEKKQAQDTERSSRRWNTKRLEVQHKARAYYLANRARLIKASDDYRRANPEKSKAWKQKHAEENREERNRRFRERFAKEPLLRARILSRDRIYRCLCIGERCGLEVRQMIGCTPTELRTHLESKFRDGMAWANHGTFWEVDHIVPLISAKTPEEVFRLSHYSNLQPLLALENQSKGVKIEPTPTVISEA